MKNSLLFLGSFIVWCSLPAQIVITNADMPSAGDSVRVSLAANTGAVDYTLTDTNYVWDFSSLVPFGQERIEFNTATAFPFNFFSDYGVTTYSPDSLPGIGALPSNFTDYYKSSSSSYRQVGSSFDFAPIGSFSIPIIYSSPDYIYRFPLSYSNRDTSDASYALTLPGLGFIGQDRHRENAVDGWGTLITPFDTFQVVRVRSVVNAVDTISLDTTNPGFTIARPTEIEYKWLALGMKYPVLEVVTQVIANAEVISSVTYQDSLRDSLFQVAVSETHQGGMSVGIFPNPAHDVVVVQYQQPVSGATSFTITDMNGQIVRKVSGPTSNLSGMLSIDISGIASGVYFISMESDSGIMVSKFVVY